MISNLIISSKKYLMLALDVCLPGSNKNGLLTKPAHKKTELSIDSQVQLVEIEMKKKRSNLLGHIACYRGGLFNRLSQIIS